jgi:hypothetical protein
MAGSYDGTTDPLLAAMLASRAGISSQQAALLAQRNQLAQLQSQVMAQGQKPTGWGGLAACRTDGAQDFRREHHCVSEHGLGWSAAGGFAGVGFGVSVIQP